MRKVHIFFLPFQLIIPKFHGARLHEIDDAYLADLLPVAKKILVEGFGEKGARLISDYNILQNNGRLAHQVSIGFLYAVLMSF
jgi:diadenosine tetraphosphate (Ap4A) HIT family hydrolase